MPSDDDYADELAPLDGPATVAENEALRAIGLRARAVNLARARRLDELVADAAAGTLTDDGREEAEQLAHQVVGSAGTFGFAGVSRLAMEAEVFFATDQPTPGQLEATQQAVRELRLQLDG